MSSSAPFVAIVISAYNAAGTLRVCLDSLKKQNYPGNKFQVIVVNDGSTDGTGKLFQKMHLPENFALIEYTENRGLATARNTGISKATGEIFIFLDADLEVAPDFIERHVSHFQKSEVIGVVGEIHPAPENPYDKYQRYLYEGRRGARACHNQQALPYKVFLFNATSLRRSAIEQVGLFDENIRSYGGEDTENGFSAVAEISPGAIL
jgi:glycosyltransferase involved in cell wall biosynthesis